MKEKLYILLLSHLRHSEAAEQRPVKIRGLVLGWTREIDSEISPTLPKVYKGSKSANFGKFFGRSRLWRAMVSKWSNTSNIYNISDLERWWFSCVL